MDGLRARHREDKWRRIRAAARALFSELGYEETTVRAIAREAGVATGTVMHYGATKAALLHEVWREGAMPVLEAALTAPWPGAGLADDLDHVLGPLIDHYAADIRLARIVVPALPYLEGEAREAHLPLLQQLVAAVAEAVERARARGEVRADLAIEEAVRMLLALYNLVLLELLAPGGHGRPEPARAALRRYTAELVTGFAPRRST